MLLGWQQLFYHQSQQNRLNIVRSLAILALILCEAELPIEMSSKIFAMSYIKPSNEYTQRLFSSVFTVLSKREPNRVSSDEDNGKKTTPKTLQIDKTFKRS